MPKLSYSSSSTQKELVAHTRNKYFLGFYFLILGVLLNSCTTKKNTVATRSYHNLTSRYNGYFYAKESLKEGITKLDKTHVDHFDKLIPVFNYTDLKESQTLVAEMDKCFKKASSVIERHSIMIKGEEHCNWIDDSYMLIGKSHFYRHDYFTALESFEYVSIQYKKLPIRYDAYLWMLRCYNELGSVALSEGMIDRIKDDKKFPKELKGDFFAIMADYYCKRDDYTFAIDNLNKAISLSKSKKDRTRYTFVLAQLYQKQGALKKASRYFGDVVKMNPAYEMAFSAKINQARCFDVESGNSADLKKQLRKMLKDDKNIEFQDQIYYALGEIADKEKERDKAIDYLKSSVKTSVSNNYQKGVSSLKLGDVFLEIPDFKGAQAYYDTAVGLLDKDFPDYDAIVIKSKSLKGLVHYLNTIEREDSLQAIAKMSELDRNAFIDKLVDKAQKEAEVKKEKEEQEKLTAQQVAISQGSNPLRSTPGLPDGSGGWYFYNQQTLSFGFGDFQKKWGNRKLEDNWRRSNKQSITLSGVDDFGNQIIQPGDTGKTLGTKGDSKGGNTINKSLFMKDIPLTDALLKKSNDSIIDAYYNLGAIYKEQLFFNDKSIDAYEALLKRYPDNRYKLSCYYQLYRGYQAIENEPKANYYKNILLNDYPNSDFALILKDPNYGKDKAFSKSEATRYYEQTYELFVLQQYAQVLNNCAVADTLFPKNQYKPKYDFLKALCMGKTSTLENYINALRLVVAKYPKDEVKKRAQDMLDVLQKKDAASVLPANNATTIIADTTKNKVQYNFNADAEHFCIIIIPTAGVDLPQQKATISDFNDASFESSNLKISDVVFNNDLQMISVKSFPNKAKAMEYYGVLKADTTLFKTIPSPEKVKMFVITAENYPVFYSNKDTALYESFFTQKYEQ